MKSRGLSAEILPDAFARSLPLARTYPVLVPLYELRSTLAKLRLTGLTVGQDGRNRCLLSPFGASSGRNTPSNSKFIYGSARWLRGLIRPPEGCALAYIDWSGQEFAIAAALSGDEQMIEDYRSGDPHMVFARAHRLVPADATADSHPAMREVCKTVNLGVLYGLTEYGLAVRLGVTRVYARQLLQLHRERYRRFWRWVGDQVNAALLTNVMSTVFGWRYHVTAGSTPARCRTFRCRRTAPK
jgi:hypothetical protein